MSRRWVYQSGRIRTNRREMGEFITLVEEIGENGDILLPNGPKGPIIRRNCFFFFF